MKSEDLFLIDILDLWNKIIFAFLVSTDTRPVGFEIVNNVLIIWRLN
jgi:hypothetical protein